MKKIIITGGEGRFATTLKKYFVGMSTLIVKRDIYKRQTLRHWVVAVMNHIHANQHNNIRHKRKRNRKDTVRLARFQSYES